MSSPSGAGPSGGGVVRNSALSFLASAQTNPAESESSSQDARDMGQSDRLVPAGLKALCEAYSTLYPDQPNPLQVTTRLKYWLGGHDPLDYISMYWNPGKPDENIPPHWHYVSFGLSDLHGDGRVHPPADRVLVSAGAPPPSGCGFELTLRLAATHEAPPLWPAALLQALARYVFTTGNKFCAGDHISWHAPLDGGAESRLRHLLIAEDPQLPAIHTSHGTLAFLQIVGCTGRELRAAQRGSGFDVLKLIADDPHCGGAWLVTRVQRRVSARCVRRGATSGAAHLAGVSARMRWEAWNPAPEEPSPPSLSPQVQRQIKETLQRGLSSMSTDRSGPEGHTGMSTDSLGMSSLERALPQIPELMHGSWREDTVEYLEGVHVVLNPEGASLLPLAIQGRVLHDHHFTWRCSGRALTVLSPAVGGALATPAAPYVVKGGWLQVLIPRELAEDMAKVVAKLEALADTDSEPDSDEEGDRQPPSLPLTLTWPRYKLKISVLYDQHVL
ncbi:suppressor of fused homolog isoform X2 [Pectinophora gossypiella]|nr:suppressor of fused homolog isoform X2 [Pectinophora gossypiella]